MTKAVLKYIEHSILYEHFTHSSKSEHFDKEQSSRDCISGMTQPIEPKFSTDIYLDEFYLPKKSFSQNIELLGLSESSDICKNGHFVAKL